MQFTLSSDLLKPTGAKMKMADPALEEPQAQCGSSV